MKLSKKQLKELEQDKQLFIDQMPAYLREMIEIRNGLSTICKANLELALQNPTDCQKQIKVITDSYALIISTNKLLQEYERDLRLSKPISDTDEQKQILQDLTFKMKQAYDAQKAKS